MPVINSLSRGKWKILLLGLSSLALLGCAGSGGGGQFLNDFSTGFMEGYDAGSRGNRFVGNTPSQDACSYLAGSVGCSTYEYSPSTGNCFCK